MLQLKGLDGKFIIYGEKFVFNFNKELSFPTSVNKAIRTSLKILNAFVGLNSNVMSELSIPLNLNINILKKSSEQLQEFLVYDNNVKLFMPTIEKDQTLYIAIFSIGAYQEIISGIGGLHHCLIPEGNELIIFEKNGKFFSKMCCKIKFL